MLFAQGVSDSNASISELDKATEILEEVRAWLPTQGEGINNAQSQAALENVAESLRFVELRLQAEFGLVQDLAERLQHFLGQDYPIDQKVSLLLFAAETQANRRQVSEAQTSLDAALELTRKQPASISPVNRYALQSMSTKLRRLGADELDDSLILKDFESATAPLAQYQVKLNPLQDIQWLVGRSATAYWTGELERLGPAGVAPLKKMLSFFEKQDLYLKRGWDQQRLTDLGMTFPSDLYIKAFADVVLISSQIDQTLLVIEALPEEVRKEAMPLQTILNLEMSLELLNKAEPLFCNAKLGPSYATFPIEQMSLVAELTGRVKLLRASYEKDPGQRATLLWAGFESIRKSDDAAAKVGYFRSIARRLAQDSEGLDRAEEVLREALLVSAENGLLSDTLQVTLELAEHFADRQDLDQAKVYAESALEAIETALPFAGQNSGVPWELQKQASKMSTLLAQCALVNDDTEAALSALSQGHQYEAAVSQVAINKSAASDLMKVEQKKQDVALLTQKVEQLKAMPASQTRDSLIQESEQLLADTRAAFLLESRNIRQKHSSLYSSVLRFDPLNLPDIQDGMSEDSAVIQYFPTENELYFFLVTRDKLRLRSAKIKKSDLDAQCQTFLKALSRLSPIKRVITLSQSLNAVLIEPVEDDLEGIERLVIIPAGSLNFLPFAALYDKNQAPLVERYAFLELAKPTDFTKIAQSRPAVVNSVTAFANATLDLPATADEGRDIVKLFEGSQLFEGQEASKKNFLEHGSEAQALHIATHGSWDTQNSLNSYLQLADGERVAQEEILALALKETALVTLSACNTALANEADSDYVASLAEAFWLAGCPTVVASLWAVEDRSTRILMTDFYSGLRSGKSKVQALREAQLKLYNNPDFTHPNYWSGFVLFGDWR